MLWQVAVVKSRCRLCLAGLRQTKLQWRGRQSNCTSNAGSGDGCKRDLRAVCLVRAIAVVVEMELMGCVVVEDVEKSGCGELMEEERKWAGGRAYKCWRGAVL